MMQRDSFLSANSSICKIVKSENFIFHSLTNYIRIAGTRISAYFAHSAILTRGIIDFLLVLWNGPLFLTKKVKLSRSALLGFNTVIFWMNIPACAPSVRFSSPSFLPRRSAQRGGSFGARSYFRHWHPLLSARFAFPPVVFSSKYRTSRYSVVEAIKGKGPGREVRVGRVSTNVWTQPEADRRKHLLVDKPSLASPRKFLNDEPETMYIIVRDIHVIPKHTLLILIRYSLTEFFFLLNNFKLPYATY